jgi:KUP system potassium uptake protein
VQGGWFPLLIGAVVFTLMSTWKRGVELVLDEAHTRAGVVPLRKFLETLIAEDLVRVAGTAVFLTLEPDAAPRALVSNVEHNKVLHERVLFVKVASREIPYVSLTERVTVAPIESNCFRVLVAYGFKDEINLPEALRSCAAQDVAIDPLKVSYFLSHVIVVACPGKGMWLWRERLFATMAQNIGNLAAYLKLPASRVIELGSDVEI